jgi:exosortase/archaeosortase family protein
MKELKKWMSAKIQLLRKKIADFESKSTYHSFFVNIITILITLLLFEAVFLLATEVIIPKAAHIEPSNSLYPIQVLEARAVYSAHSALGYPVELKNEIGIYYYSQAFRNSELSMSIQAPCVGIHEIVFLSALITGFRGVACKLKLKWIAILGSVLFIENLIRLLLLYPIALWVGEDTMWYYHYIFWKYGHLIIILTLFVIWFLFVAMNTQRRRK